MINRRKESKADYSVDPETTLQSIITEPDILVATGALATPIIGQ
jgi:hypothetical protein